MLLEYTVGWKAQEKVVFSKRFAGFYENAAREALYLWPAPEGGYHVIVDKNSQNKDWVSFREYRFKPTEDGFESEVMMKVNGKRAELEAETQEIIKKLEEAYLIIDTDPGNRLQNENETN